MISKWMILMSYSIIAIVASCRCKRSSMIIITTTFFCDVSQRWCRVIGRCECIDKSSDCQQWNGKRWTRYSHAVSIDSKVELNVKLSMLWEGGPCYLLGGLCIDILELAICTWCLVLELFCGWSCGLYVCGWNLLCHPTQRRNQYITRRQLQIPKRPSLSIVMTHDVSDLSSLTFFNFDFASELTMMRWSSLALHHAWSWIAFVVLWHRNTPIHCHWFIHSNTIER